MRIAFVGGSGHAFLRRLIGKEPGLEVAVVTDPHDRAASGAMADALTGAARFEDVATMATTFRPDVVNVGTVYGHTGDFVFACLERGLPVVSDKPVAATWPQFERIAKLCERGVPLLTELDFRARATFRAARKAVRDGLIGDVALITAQKSYRWGRRPAWYLNRADYASTLLWIASHAIDAVRFVGGAEPVTVVARQANVTRGAEWGTAEDVAVATYALPNGGTAVVHADFLRPAKAATHGDDRLRVAGGTGVIEIRDDRCVLTTHDEPERDITEWGAGGPSLERALLDAAMGRSTDDAYSTTETLKTAELLLRTRDAADAGTMVRL